MAEGARDLGARFGQRRNFMSDLEVATPAFYEQIGQHLKGWQPNAPRMSEKRAMASAVEPSALAEETAQQIEDAQSATD